LLLTYDVVIVVRPFILYLIFILKHEEFLTKKCLL